MEKPERTTLGQAAVRCDACGFHQFPMGHCADCGSEMAQGRPMAISAAITLEPLLEEPSWLGIDRKGWLALATGSLAAAATLMTLWLAYIFGFITTIVHELGHSLGGWLFGYPSIPSFDFAYGGGVTLQQQRIIWLVFIVALVFIWYMTSYRRNRLSLLLLAAAFALYGIMAATSVHQGIVLAMGHGAELVFAGFLLYRAMSGAKLKHEFFRSAYAFLGLFILMDNVRFSYLLAFDEAQRYHYQTVSAIGFQMDFSRLADQYLATSVSNVALAFLILCLLTPAFSYLYLRKQQLISWHVQRLKQRNPNH